MKAEKKHQFKISSEIISCQKIGSVKLYLTYSNQCHLGSVKGNQMVQEPYLYRINAYKRGSINSIDISQLHKGHYKTSMNTNIKCES